MARYLLVASRDPFESAEAGRFYDLAADLARSGDEVSLFLCQNGVLSARRAVQPDRLTALAGGGVRILADAFSLRERGIDSARLVGGVEAVEVDVVVDALEAGHKVIWH